MTTKTLEQLKAHCIKLWDTQWMNVVNHDNCYRDFTKEDAIAHAVKLTEEYFRKNFEDYLAAEAKAVPELYQFREAPELTWKECSLPEEAKRLGFEVRALYTKQQPAAQKVIVDFDNIGSAGPFPSIDGRIVMPATTMEEMFRMAFGHTGPSSFKNFHRSLCERFGYVHDEKDWHRDLASLEEHIAKRVQPAEVAPNCINVTMSVGLNPGHYEGWIFAKHADGQWVTVAKLQPFGLSLMRAAMERKQ